MRCYMKIPEKKKLKADEVSQILIRVPTATLKRFDLLAKKKGYSRTELVVYLITTAVEENP